MVGGAVSWALGCLLGLTCPPTPGLVSTRTHGQPRSRSWSLLGSSWRVNHNIEEVEANMKELGINLVQG